MHDHLPFGVRVVMTFPARQLALAHRWEHRQATAISVTPPLGRYVFVIPHPDDESLVVGGLMARLHFNGADVRVVAVTDGGSAYPHDYDHDELAVVRRAEQVAALDCLGVTQDRVTSLGLRDGHVAKHESAVSEAIAASCTRQSTIIAPWRRDVHPDHEAVGRAAQAAAERCSSSIWSSIFWAWHHLEPDDLDNERMIKISVAAHRAQKDAAIACHRTQLCPDGVDPILDDIVLEPSRWAHEYFILHPENSSPPSTSSRTDDPLSR